MSKSYKSELALFQTKLYERARLDRPDYRDLYDRMMRRLESSKADLIALSDLGVPAWLVLFPIWLLVLTKSLPPINKRYKSAKTWKRLARDIDSLVIRLTESPLLDGLDSELLPDTTKLINEMNKWSVKLKQSPFVDETREIWGMPNADGTHSIWPGERRHRGMGKRAPAADENPNLVSWTLIHCIRTLTGNPHWDLAAGVIYGFLSSWLVGRTEDPGQTLQTNVDHYVKRMGRDLSERRANAILNNAVDWHLNLTREQQIQSHSEPTARLDWTTALKKHNPPSTQI